MISLNKATILGNSTRDPELKYTPNGQAVCNFSVATNRRFKNTAGDLQEDTQYHDVVVWGKLAEVIAQIIKKGSKIYVEGRLQTNQWDAPDGSKRSRTEIVLDQFIPLTPKSGTYETGISAGDADSVDSAPAAAPKKGKKADDAAPVTPSSDEDINLDDIPF